MSLLLLIKHQFTAGTEQYQEETTLGLCKPNGAEGKTRGPQTASAPAAKIRARDSTTGASPPKHPHFRPLASPCVPACPAHTPITSVTARQTAERTKWPLQVLAPVPWAQRSPVAGKKQLAIPTKMQLFPRKKSKLKSVEAPGEKNWSTQLY